MTEAAPANGEIFIVDDDPAIRQMLSIVFSQAGFHATCFADGAALLASTRTMVPACIILDVNIPGRSGLDILKQLNAEDWHERDRAQAQLLSMGPVASSVLKKLRENQPPEAQQRIDTVLRELDKQRHGSKGAGGGNPAPPIIDVEN